MLNARISDMVADFERRYPTCTGDAYAFAEYVCDELEYFGHPNDLMESGELESAWEEAQSWYNIAKGVRA